MLQLIKYLYKNQFTITPDAPFICIKLNKEILVLYTMLMHSSAYFQAPPNAVDFL